MVTPYDLEFDQEYYDILEDGKYYVIIVTCTHCTTTNTILLFLLIILFCVFCVVKLECSPFGEVLQVLIPRAKDGFPPQSEGSIFVEFARPDFARAAAASLIGRKFADRIVIVDYYNESLYHNRRF
jgi:hypothetical protein